MVTDNDDCYHYKPILFNITVFLLYILSIVITIISTIYTYIRYLEICTLLLYCWAYPLILYKQLVAPVNNKKVICILKNYCIKSHCSIFFKLTHSDNSVDKLLVVDKCVLKFSDKII